MTFPVITLSYLIPISLIHSFLSIRVVFARTRLRVPFGDGGQDELARRIRAHGNLIEYLPLAIILMGSLEILGERPMVMHAAMALLLAARIAHPGTFWARTGSPVYYFCRIFGAFTTWAVMTAATLRLIFLLP